VPDSANVAGRGDGANFLSREAPFLDREVIVSELKEMRCEACAPGSPPASAEERERFGAEIPEWEITEEDGQERLRRVFRFPEYPAAVEFTRRVAEIAEQEGHHPAILLEWGRVTVSWWTHAIGGLHRNDFIMAARTDALRKGE
jgi:4a-hydroxytetrahydrobiopterin dehydratase